MSDYLATNLFRAAELLPRVQWAAKRWCQECDDKKLQFRISEAYRSQERQNYLYKIGRRGVEGEKPVTWTLHSKHIERVAVDVYPTNCTYEQIEEVAKKYGIYRPKETLSVGDFAHFQFDRVGPEPDAVPEPKTNITPETRVRALARRFKNFLEPKRSRLLKLLSDRFHLPPS